MTAIPGLKTEDGLCLLVGADQMWKLLLNEVFFNELQQGLVSINTNISWNFQGPIQCEEQHSKRAATTTICVLYTSCVDTDIPRFLQKLLYVGIENETVRSFSEQVHHNDRRLEVRLPSRARSSTQAKNQAAAEPTLHSIARHNAARRELKQ